MRALHLAQTKTKRCHRRQKHRKWAPKPAKAEDVGRNPISCFGNLVENPEGRLEVQGRKKARKAKKIQKQNVQSSNGLREDGGLGTHPLLKGGGGESKK